MAAIPLNDPAIAALGSILGTDLLAVSRDGVEIARITVANFFTDAALTGTPTSSTPPTANSSTRIATTAYVKNNLSLYGLLSATNTWITGQKFGNGLGSSDIEIAGAAGNTRRIIFKTGALNRIELGASDDSESGSEVGSVLYCYTYNDAGASPYLNFTISRDSTQPIFINRELDIIHTVGIQPVSGPALQLGNAIEVNTLQVITDRQTGWSAATGTLSRAALDGSAATLAQTREALAALITDLTTHGLIGA